MERRMLKNKIISLLLLVVILAADFNFLPVQSIINQASQSTAIVAYAATTKAGKWIKESNGKWWYKHTDGTYTKNDWEYINGYWYHFDSSGYMQTGWLKVDGKWYHLNSEGKMHIGWVKIGNYWYHFDSNGVRQTGWQKLNGNWYYFNSDGIRQVGWVKVGNYWYHLDSEGIMQTGWQKLNGNWYYFNSDGVRQVGWQQVDGKWYHLNSEGIMETGWVKIGTEWYFFHSTGERYVGWLTDNGKTYHFNSSGIMDIGWKKINDYWYFFNYEGSMQLGWKKIDGSWYYFNMQNGQMNTKTFTENQRKYYFNSSGALYRTDIDIDVQQQQKTLWCWAACAVMVGRYNTNSTISQKNIVAKFTGSENNNVPGNPYITAQAVYYASNNTKKSTLYFPGLKFTSSSSSVYKSAVDMIDDNHPFIIAIADKETADKILNQDIAQDTVLSGSGHMVVCSGYDKEDNTLKIVNPWKLTPTKFYSYDDIMEDVYFNPVEGRCIMMIAY